VNRNAKVVLIAVGMIILILLAGKCAYGAGEWLGSH
jgi:hypothetical protein